MKRLRMSFAASTEYKPEHPERTAKRASGDWDVEICIFTNRPAMLKAIRMQEQREYRRGDFRPYVPERSPYITIQEGT